MLVKITLFAALLLSIVVPFAYFLSGTKNKARYKLTIGTNAAALGAISEDSSILGKSLIFVGLAEGVCLYGLIISFMILGQL